jgi:ferrochelatase
MTSEYKNEFYITSEEPTKKAIVLLQMGGPNSLNEIRDFLLNLFRDPYLIQLPFYLRPFQSMLAKFISNKRQKKVAPQYEIIGGKSPILENTTEFASQLHSIFEKKYHPVDIAVVMRYSSPRSIDSIKILKKRGIDKVILFPLYPHYSESTAGSSIKDFKVEAKRENFSAKWIEINDWGKEEFYLNWWIHQIKSELKTNQSKNIKILFTAHGLPQSYIDRGDKYKESIENATKLIMEKFPGISWNLSFQSRVGRQKWIEPYTDDKINDFSTLSYTNLVVVPIGFISDHLETLYELDILYRNQFTQNKDNLFSRVSVPNASSNFAYDMAEYISSITGDKF